MVGSLTNTRVFFTARQGSVNDLQQAVLGRLVTAISYAMYYSFDLKVNGKQLRQNKAPFAIKVVV